MTAPEETPSRVPAEIVAERFAIRERVGAGAMGEVFVADDLTTGARVALKRMMATRDAGRFSDEREVLRRLAHPAIVGYVDHGTDADGRPWLTTGLPCSERAAGPHGGAEGSFDTRPRVPLRCGPIARSCPRPE